MSPPTELLTVISHAPVSKRKREEENTGRKKERNDKESYNVRYIGESNRSGYERGREHMAQFKNMHEGSHLLKHYLRCHKDIDIEQMEVGMKIKSSFKSAVERQISEVWQYVEQRKKE